MIKPVNIDHKHLDQFKNFNVAQQQQQKVLVPISWVPISWDGKKKRMVEMIPAPCVVLV
jgi:hypothetical protein